VSLNFVHTKSSHMHRCHAFLSCVSRAFLVSVHLVQRKNVAQHKSW